MTHLSTLVEIAAELRSRAGQTKPPFSTTKIIESCFPEILVTGFALPAQVDELVASCSEGPTILYSRNISGPEQRFAIAHGLGHLLFDDRHACVRPGRAGIPKIERRADAFGAELLAPRAELRTRVERLPADEGEEREIYLDHVDQLASLFAMPANVIDLQIRRLGLTDKNASRLCLTNW